MGPKEGSVVERQSIVGAPVERVWERIVTPEGINHELRPWMTMSMPRGAESLTVDSVPVGTPIGRCWLRLFGVLPFDYDRLCIVDLQRGRGFHEESTMMSMRLWRHERTLTGHGEGKPLSAIGSHSSSARDSDSPHRWSAPACGRYSDTGTGDYGNTSARQHRDALDMVGQRE